MEEDKSLFFLTDSQKRLLSKKELEFVRQGFAEEIELHSPHRLKRFIKLSRELHSKYHSLTQGQTMSRSAAVSFKTNEKAKIFERLVAAYERQAKKRKMDDLAKKAQAKLDREQHYDMDGATVVHGHVAVT